MTYVSHMSRVAHIRDMTNSFTHIPEVQVAHRSQVRSYMTYVSHMSRISHMHDASIHQKCEYGVATISGLLQIIGLFCRI